jgi:hypothetical protein
MIYDPRVVSAVCRLKKSWAYKLSILTGLGVFNVQNKRKSKSKANRQRERGWALRQMDEMPDGLFKRMFRLDRATFDAHTYLLHGHMRERDVQKAINSSGSAITTKTRLAVALRWLAGGNHHDICFAFAISTASFYSADGCLWGTLKALDECISLSFPIDSPDELNRLADEFGSQSSGAFQGCVGAIDGLLLKTRAPYSSEHENPSAFKNRKCSYGILALAVADLRGKFLMFNVNSSGSTHDSVAWRTCTLQDRIAKGELPEGLFLIGDEAFSCTNQLQSPWSGRGLGRFKDSYNFYLSSSRQCVERAFGMLVKRWGVLQRKIQCDFERWSLVALVCAKLHNVCCDSNIPPPARWIDDVLPNDLPMVYLNDANTDIDREEVVRTRAPNGLINRREAITSFLQNTGMGRPVNNSQSRA